MFSNIYWNPFTSKIYLWEIINGKKIKSVYDDIDYEYYIKDENSNIKDINGVPVSKRTTKSKKQIKNLIETGSYICESDLSEEMKFLHNRYKNVEMETNMKDFNIASIDIEVATESEFPKPEDAKYPINLITIHFSKNNEMYTFAYDKNNTYTRNKIKNYYHYTSEFEMLENFIKVFRKQKVDILTGWHIQKHLSYSMVGFDIEYIINRLEILNIKKSLSPINKIEKTKFDGYKICGISVLDYQALYKKFSKDKQESYSLDYICSQELGVKKLEYDGSIIDLWKRDWNKFVEYNVRDVLLIKKLEEKFKYIELTIKTAYESFIPFEKVFSSIAVLTGYIYKELKKENMVMPNKKYSEQESFPGAYVYAEVGSHKKLISYDVESLYPHCMMAWNISPETLLIDGDPKIKQCKNLIKSPINGVYYNGDKEGIIPRVIRKIFNERKEFKALKEKHKDNTDLKNYYDRQQYIRKIMINSAYGVCGNRFFHFYNLTNAKCVTMAGQDIIKYLSNSINKYFMEYFWKDKRFFSEQNEDNKIKKEPIVLIDTDSNYICLEEVYNKVNNGESFLDWARNFDTEFFESFFEKILVIYAKKYNIKPIINFKREKIIKKQLIVARKKYATEVLDDEGEICEPTKIKITGLESVKTSTPKFCRDEIKSALRKIFDTEDKQIMLEFLSDIKKRFKKQKPKDIAFPRGVSNYKKYANGINLDSVNINKGTPIANRAAIYYNAVNKKYNLRQREITDGNKIKFIYIKPDNMYKTNIIAFIDDIWPDKFNDIFKIDYNLQFEKSVLEPIQRFFDTLGWGKIDLKNKNLSKFFNKKT